MNVQLIVVMSHLDVFTLVFRVMTTMSVLMTGVPLTLVATMIKSIVMIMMTVPLMPVTVLLDVFTRL
jgi:hypothetical protein